MLGSRLASFAGLLEVVAAALYAWLLLGEALTPLQLVGGLLILAGIAFVRSDKSAPDRRSLRAQLEPESDPAAHDGSWTSSATCRRRARHPPAHRIVRWQKLT